MTEASALEVRAASKNAAVADSSRRSRLESTAPRSAEPAQARHQLLDRGRGVGIDQGEELVVLRRVQLHRGGGEQQQTPTVRRQGLGQLERFFALEVVRLIEDDQVPGGIWRRRLGSVL